MEETLGLIQFPTCPSWILGITCLLLGFYWYYLRYFCFLDKYGITGPLPLPFIGTMYRAFKKGGLANAEIDLYAQYKAKGVCRTFLFQTPFISVTDTEIMKEILVKRFNDFPNRLVFDINSPEFERGLTVLQDDHWKHVRNIISPTFTSGKLKNMMRLVNTAAESFQESMTEKMSKGDVVNMKDAAGAYTMDVIASTMFGIQVDSQKDPNDPFVKNAKKLFDLSLGNWKFLLIVMFPNLGPWMKKCGIYLFDKNITDFFADVVNQVIEERKTGNQNYVDFMELVVNEEVGNDAIDRETALPTGTKFKWSSKGILREEIMSNAVVFFLAGYDTTASTMAALAYNLAMNPDIQDKVIEEIDEQIPDQDVTYESIHKLNYLDMALSESLRLFPPIIRFDRIPNKDVTVNGVTFPKGTSVGFPIFAMQRDPDIWPDPEKFDPERFTPEAKAARNPYHYMPFGMGQRACIGMRLATMEIKVALATFYAKNKFVRCDQTPEKLEIEALGLIKFKTPIILKIESRN